jgi:uncharacterized protein (TIGR03643 family)
MEKNYFLNNFLMEQKDIDRIIEMAWEDRTPFEAIKIQFNFSEANVIALMRRELKRSSFNQWRKRVNSCLSQKHLKKRSVEISRFKCTRQKTISGNKISKR